MKRYKVEELMVPIGEFVTVSASDSFAAAIMSLAMIREKYYAGESRANLLFVVDNSGKIISKLSPKDMLKGLEPVYAKVLDQHASPQTQGFGYLITQLRDDIDHSAGLWDNVCVNTKDLIVGDIASDMSQSQIIHEGENMNEAIHRFLLAGYDSLFVIRGETLIGVLVFSEVFIKIIEHIQECKIP